MFDFALGKMYRCLITHGTGGYTYNRGDVIKIKLGAGMVVRPLIFVGVYPKRIRVSAYVRHASTLIPKKWELLSDEESLIYRMGQ